MPIFVDTSAFIAALSEVDPSHQSAAALFLRAEPEHWILITTNCVVHESWSLIQRRFGWQAVDDFLGTVLPFCEVIDATA